MSTPVGSDLEAAIPLTLETIKREFEALRTSVATLRPTTVTAVATANSTQIITANHATTPTPAITLSQNEKHLLQIKELSEAIDKMHPLLKQKGDEVDKQLENVEKLQNDYDRACRVRSHHELALKIYDSSSVELELERSKKRIDLALKSIPGLKGFNKEFMDEHNLLCLLANAVRQGSEERAGRIVRGSRRILFTAEHVNKIYYAA